MSLDALFSPFTIKGLTLPNRIVMAPMTRSFSPNGVPTSDVAAYYRRRAEGGVGLIVTEGTVVERPAARNDANVPVFHGEALPEWKSVVEEVHAAGGLIAPQIWHVGSARGRGDDWAPLGKVDSPSGMTMPGKTKLEPMTEEDVADTIAAFGRSARAARDLGFSVPEELSIVGIDGHELGEFFRLTTVDQFPLGQGERAADAVLAKLATPDAVHIPSALPYELNVRGTTARLL